MQSERRCLLLLELFVHVLSSFLFRQWNNSLVQCWHPVDKLSSAITAQSVCLYMLITGLLWTQKQFQWWHPSHALFTDPRVWLQSGVYRKSCAYNIHPACFMHYLVCPQEGNTEMDHWFTAGKKQQKQQQKTESCTKSHTMQVCTTFEFKRTSRPLEKCVLYSTNMSSKKWDSPFVIIMTI